MGSKIFIGEDVGNEGDLGTAANWSPTGLPESDDVAWFTEDSANVTDGFDDLAAITLAELHFMAGWTGRCESDYIQIGATKVWIGEHWGTGEPGGSPRLKLYITGATTVEVLRTSTASDDDFEMPARFKINHADAVLVVRKGMVGVCVGDPTETGELSEIRVGFDESVESDAEVAVGAGVTLATLTKTGGKCLLNCAATTVTHHAGELRTEGAGAITALTTRGGLIIPNSSGTIATLTQHGGVVDLLRSNVARAITTLARQGGTFKYDPAVVTVGTITETGRMAIQAGGV